MKKRNKNLIVFVLVLSIAFTFAACNADDEGNADGDISDSTPLVTIGDKTAITMSELDEYVNCYGLLNRTASQGRIGLLERSTLNVTVLDFFMEIETLKQFYEQEGVDVLPSDYDKQFSKFKDEFLQKREDMEERMEEEGVTDETLDFYFSSQFYQNKLEEDLKKDEPVTDKEVSAYYEKNKSTFVTPAQLRVSHIIVEDRTLSEASRTSIEAIKTRLMNGEASFEELARETNTDDTAKTGGDLGWIDENSNMSLEFLEAAMALPEIGTVTDVVQSKDGFHLVMLTDSKDAEQKPLSKVSDDIKETLQKEKYTKKVETLKDELNVSLTKAGKEIMDL